MTEADRAGQLGPADLVRLATAASLIGCHTEGIDLSPRANAEYLRLGDVSGAEWSAGWAPTVTDPRRPQAVADTITAIMAQAVVANLARIRGATEL